MEKAFKGINHGKGQINLTHHKTITQMLPVEIHLKEDGALGDLPSFLIVMTSPLQSPVCCQISLRMLNEGLADIGYELIKKP